MRRGRIIMASAILLAFTLVVWLPPYLEWRDPSQAKIDALSPTRQPPSSAPKTGLKAWASWMTTDTVAGSRAADAMRESAKRNLIIALAAWGALSGIALLLAKPAEKIPQPHQP